MNRVRNWLAGGIILCVILLFSISGKYVDWLWFKSMGATSVFWVPLITGPLTKLIVGVIIACFFLINVWIALRAFDRVKIVDELWVDIPKTAVFLPGIGVSLVLAFILASGFSVDWTAIQQYLHRVAVGLKDPIFHQDLGYYLFAFPFYQQINSLLQITTFLGLAGTAFIYFIAKAFWKQGRSWEVWHPAKTHLTMLTVFFLAAKIYGYSLGKYGLLFQDAERMTGVNYTAAHAKIMALTFLTWFLVALIAFLVISLFRKGVKLLAVSLIAWIICSMALNAVYPGIIQAWVVAPNEFEREKQYLANHIQFTRMAYGLDKIKIKSFSPQEKYSAVNLNNPSLSDMRLWDYKPLGPSYNQLQSIRTYYQFHGIDIDRYPSQMGRRQVMIAARELNPDRLSSQAQTWLNLHLIYTHGYGFAANEVSQFSSQGQPIFIAKDLPPRFDPNYPAFNIKEPQIYYGELTNTYSIVHTKTAEFDFPQGDSNVNTRYHGKNGIPLSSGFTKLLMALKFQEINFMISPLLTGESKVLIYRNIEQRVSKLAPFLSYDSDPYLVVSEGKLFWIIDAYTTSSYYPYAKYHENGFNYIRNSVKVVINAYDGSVNFYIIDPNDPLIKVWRNIFPHLFSSPSSLSQDLKQHFRYPEYLMKIQRDMLRQFHMTNTKTFYEKEDYWDVPIHNRDELFEPYYVTLKLPEESANEFAMMQPFTPRDKQNLISWLVARCDSPHYGEMQLFNLPKNQTIYGPAQIDSRINQDQTISQLITLWNQNQSRVVWGNLLIIPIENSILYVKPLYLESEQSQQAELKKIVIVYQNQVLLGDTVAEALGKVSAPGLNQPVTTTNTIQENAPKAQTNRKAEILKRLDELVKEQQRLLNELRNTP